jgi:predicted transcriptional regulator
MNTDKSTKLKRVSFISESGALAKMEELASDRNTSLSHIIREAISLYLKQNGEAAK